METVPRRLRLLLGGGGGVGGCGEARPRGEMSTSTSDTVSPEGFMEQARYRTPCPKLRPEQRKAKGKQGKLEVPGSQKAQNLMLPGLESPPKHLGSPFYMLPFLYNLNGQGFFKDKNMGLTVAKSTHCDSATDNITLTKPSLFKWKPFIFTDLHTNFCLREQSEQLVTSPSEHRKQVPKTVRAAWYTACK